MHSIIATFIDRLDSPAVASTPVIAWGAPVPSFGDLQNAVVASVGLNPSNREFVDDTGRELDGKKRRFYTLGSLGLKSWSDASARDIELIEQSCSGYFSNNPYDRWFKKLDQVVAGTGASFYSALYPACHLDLIPYATAVKWMELSQSDRRQLLDCCADALGLLLRESRIRVLLLNGRTVVDQFEEAAGLTLDEFDMPAWSLPRNSGRDVSGKAHIGRISTFAGISLDREVLVLGYNHNLQSSFGITSQAIRGIRDWIADMCAEVLR